MCRIERMALWGEKGIRCESVTETAAVCMQCLALFDESQSLGN